MKTMLCLAMLLGFAMNYLPAQPRFRLKVQVVDSLTQEPIPFVYISTSNRRQVSVTDEQGLFTIETYVGDTLHLSHVGYFNRRIMVLSRLSLTVAMREQTTLMQPVVIYGRYKPFGADEWHKAPPSNLPGENAALRPGIQTFGASGTVQGPISYFSKGEKEKRKLKKMKAENEKTSVFRQAMSSEDMQERIKKLFNLSDEEYGKRIARFNQQYPDAAYSRTQKELEEMIVYFMASYRD